MSATSVKFGPCALVAAVCLLGLASSAGAQPLKVQRIDGYPSTCESYVSAAASDGALWLICAPSASKRYEGLVRVSPSGKVSGPFRPPNEPYDKNTHGRFLEPEGLVAGPAGSMWFSSGFGLVCSVSAAGAMHCARTPTSLRERGNTSTRTIVEGPEGNMWMSQAIETNGGPLEGASIVRITPDLQMTEFPLPPEVVPLGLVRSPSRDLWFGAEARTPSGPQGTIRTISPTGELTTYPLSSQAGGTPAAILALPSSELFFQGGSNGERLLRVSANGNQSLVVDVSASMLANEPVATPDGAVWMLAQSLKAGAGRGYYRPGAIYRVAPGGTTSTFALSGRFKLSYFGPGLNGLIWAIAEGYSEKALRLVSITPDGQVLTHRSFDKETGVPLSLGTTPGALWLVASSVTSKHTLKYVLERITD